MFESEETVFGRVRQSNERIERRGTLEIGESRKDRVSLELVFVPPHPFISIMPERASIRAQSMK
jgi:hypothetical protein